jgi:phage gp37-like protein
MLYFSNMYSFVWFQTDPTAALEECIISILVGLARHSPTCANAIMKCQRLVETVVQRFTMKDNIEIHPSKIKSVRLLKVSNFLFLGEILDCE